MAMFKTMLHSVTFGYFKSKSKGEADTAKAAVPPSSPPPSPPPPKRLALVMKEKSKRITGSQETPSIYCPPLTGGATSIPGCKRYVFGRETVGESRTIMVLGATGAGKSTLINGMFNYLMGVEWNDPFRFKLICEPPSSQTKSQTADVTAYVLNHLPGFAVSYSLTIIDTPGYGDTQGIERDREITGFLDNFFRSPNGITELHAICFVAQAALARLTPSQKYVFDSVLSIFGKDVAENIRVLVTFADAHPPPVLEAIKESGVPYTEGKNGLPAHFKFNNSALFTDNTASDQDYSDFGRMFWKMGVMNMKDFFVGLNLTEARSLMLTKDVLQERKQLENSIQNIQKRVKFGLAKLDEIRQIAKVVKDHEAEISRNEKFEFYVTVKEPVQEDISQTGVFLTNCQQCQYTCHDNCAYADDKDKEQCCAMGKDGYCLVCPGVKKNGKVERCHWKLHFNMKYKFTYREVRKKQTAEDLKERFFKAKKAKASVQDYIEKVGEEYTQVQEEVVALMERAATCLNRLKEIALKPNPLSTPEYIDLLIQTEQSEAKDGWEQRVRSLFAMREAAVYMARVDRGETLLQKSPLEFLLSQSSEVTTSSSGQGGAGSDVVQDTGETNVSEDEAGSDGDPDAEETQLSEDEAGSDGDPDAEETQLSEDETGSDGDPDAEETQLSEDEAGSVLDSNGDSDSDSNPEEDKEVASR